MVSTPSSARAYAHHEGNDDLLASEDLAVAEDALSKLAQKVARHPSDWPTVGTSDLSADLRATEPLFAASTLRPSAANNYQLPSDRPALRRVVWTFAAFVLAAGIGVAATLAWLLCSEAGRQGPEVVAKQPSSSAVEAAAADAVPAAPLAQASTAGPSPDLAQQQLGRDLATVRQSVDQLMANQEQMARDIARLRAAEEDSRHKRSASPQRPAAAPARKPVSTLPPPQPADRLSSAPPPPALPPPPSRPPMPLP